MVATLAATEKLPLGSEDSLVSKLISVTGLLSVISSRVLIGSSCSVDFWNINIWSHARPHTYSV